MSDDLAEAIGFENTVFTRVREALVSQADSLPRARAVVSFELIGRAPNTEISLVRRVGKREYRFVVPIQRWRDENPGIDAESLADQILLNDIEYWDIEVPHID